MEESRQKAKRSHMRRIGQYAVAMAVAVVVAAVPGCVNAQTVPPTEGAAMASTSDSLVCRVIVTGRLLPEEVRETSGLSRSRNDPSLFWTHNDSGGGANLYAITAEGKLARHVRIAGAKSVDWEDIESGPCAEGSCLYIADTGDNDGRRGTIDIYRMTEPSVSSTTNAKAVKMAVRYPDGPQDAEALFVSPSQEVFIVTKGRHGAIKLYSMPAQQNTRAVVTLTKVRELFAQPTDENDRVTSATMSPDGKWVAVRTYRKLHFYRAASLMSPEAVTPMSLDLTPLAEVQGEAVAMSNDGAIWLSSEAEDNRMMPTWSRITCVLPPAAE